MAPEIKKTATADDNPMPKWHTLPYIRTAAEVTGHMLAMYGIRVERKQVKRYAATLCQHRTH